MGMKYKTILLTLVGFFIVSLASNAFGMPILPGINSGGGVWTAIDPEGRDAKAVFSQTSSGFDIVLLNLALETSSPNEVLAGLFFELNNGTASSPHVIVEAGSTIFSSKYPLPLAYGTNFDGEWAFRSGINGINGGLGNYGISSSAFDPESGAPADWDGFGNEYIIDASKSYVPPTSVNGAEWGMVSGDTSNLPSSVHSYVDNAVRISFNFNSGPFDVANDVERFYFLYGTDYKVPEPSTMILLGTGIMGIVAFRKKLGW